MIKEEHRSLLLKMGLKQEDFQHFDGKHVTYQWDEEKGVRLYDPYYRTSYNEYIDVDGWSVWSSEADTFMSDLLKVAKEAVERRETISQRPSEKELAQALEKKFLKKDP